MFTLTWDHQFQQVSGGRHGRSVWRVESGKSIFRVQTSLNSNQKLSHCPFCTLNCNNNVIEIKNQRIFCQCNLFYWFSSCIILPHIWRPDICCHSVRHSLFVIFMIRFTKIFTLETNISISRLIFASWNENFWVIIEYSFSKVLPFDDLCHANSYNYIICSVSVFEK